LQDIITIFKIGYGYLKWIVFKPKEKLPEKRNLVDPKHRSDIKLEYEPEHLKQKTVKKLLNFTSDESRDIKFAVFVNAGIGAGICRKYSQSRLNERTLFG